MSGFWSSLKFFATAPVFAIANPTLVSADTNLVEIGKLAYVAWSCAATGSIAQEEKTETERLFIIGYENASTFLLASSNGEVTEEVFSKVPIGLSLNLSHGPTPGFQLGVLWARIESHVYDRHWPKDLGASFDEKQEIQIQSARNAFHNGNCELIK
ncbi:MAG: hypothetical protein ACK4RN_01660 [Pseudorhodobacter sp.]